MKRKQRQFADRIRAAENTLMDEKRKLDTLLAGERDKRNRLILWHNFLARPEVVAASEFLRTAESPQYPPATIGHKRTVVAVSPAG